jgi:hypothetical protein
MGLIGTIITHHVTSYFLLTYLILRAIVAVIVYKWNDTVSSFTNIALLAIVLILSYMVYIARSTIEYVSTPVISAILDLVKIAIGENEGRALFSGDSGPGLAGYERVIVYSGALIILFGIAVSALLIWRYHRKQVTYIVLGISALLYPVTQVLRFTENGSELGGRIGPFMFVGIAFTITIGVLFLYQGMQKHRNRYLILVVLVSIMFYGNILVSFVRWAILPGDYLAAADARSIDIHSIEASNWLLKTFGPNNLIGSDRINTLIMAGYGRQQAVTASYDQVDVPGIFLDPQIDANEYDEICRGQIEFLIVDMRFVDYMPTLGFYYESGEMGALGYHSEPIYKGLFKKFEEISFMNRVYDSGNIVIYQVRNIACH